MLGRSQRLRHLARRKFSTLARGRAFSEKPSNKKFGYGFTKKSQQLKENYTFKVEESAVGLARPAARDYSGDTRIRRTLRHTPVTIDKGDVKNPMKAKYYEPVRNRATNIFLTAKDKDLLRHPESSLAVAELHRRAVMEEMRAEAESGLSDIAAAGYEDLDAFDLLDEDKNGTLDKEELHVIADILNLGTGEELWNEIKEYGDQEVADVTPDDFYKWYERYC